MTGQAALRGQLSLGDLLHIAGLDPDDILLLRHTFTDSGLRSSADLAPEPLLTYVRRQEHGNKVGRVPPRLWLNFIADGKRRSRFVAAYENAGERIEERTDQFRYFDLSPSPALEALTNRLVVEWPADAVNWAKRGMAAAAMSVMEIADPEAVAFPGFDDVLLTYDELQLVVSESRYASWRTALASVQGVYAIADRSDGQIYIGKADGSERILGRWRSYANDGHGGNVALRELARLDVSRRSQFVFSILRVFGPSVPAAEVDRAEAHFKRALLTREWGLNRN